MMECEGTMHLSCTYCREDAEMDEKRLQSIMDHAVETGELAGCSLLLIKDRKPVCYLESGLADRENNIPVRRENGQSTDRNSEKRALHIAPVDSGAAACRHAGNSVPAL